MDYLKLFTLLLVSLGLLDVGAGQNKLCEDKLNPVLADLDTLLEEECAFAAVVKNYLEMKMKQADISTNDTKKIYAEAEIKKSLTKAMPNGNDKQMTVSLWSIEITDLYAYTAHEVNIRGIMLLSWNDDRLAWRYNDKPPVDSMVIHSEKSIWTPDIAYVLSKNYFPYSGNRKTMLHRNGTVWYHQGFWIRSNCDLDLSNYPNDVQHCCLQFQSKKFPNKLVVDIKSKKLDYSPIARFRTWRPLTSSITQGKDDNGNPRFNVCFDLIRPSATMNYFILLPLSATVVIAVLIPLFTTWKLQIMAKMLAIFLQYLSLNLTFENEIKTSTTVPKYLQLYEFLIWTTVLSMCATVIFWACARRKYNIPPQRSLLDMAEKVNPWFCAVVVSETSTKTESEAEGTTTGGAGGWYHVYVAMNNLSLVIFTVVYIIGTIVFVV